MINFSGNFIDQNRQDFFRLIKLISYCPFCERHYNPMMAKVIEQSQDGYLVHLECGHCGCLIITLIITSFLGISSVGLVTDLTPEEVLKFKKAQNVSSDDVIEIYHLMRQKEGIIKLIDS